MKLGLEFVMESTQGRLLTGSKSVEISGISTDSRLIKPGELFIALQGENFDGHDYILTALDQGAAAIVISRPDCLPADGANTAVILVNDTLEALQRLAAGYRQLFTIPVVAITGSVGKTTTKDILAECLSASFKTHKTKANYNNEIGLPLTILDLETEHQAAVLELGMRAPREIQQLASLLQPSYAIISNVEAVHLETMGSLTNIAQAKCEVLEFIKEGYFALVNGDNELLLKTAKNYSCRIFTFGYQAHNDIQILSVDNDGRGINVGLRIFACRDQFYLPLPVNQLATNLASAVGMAFLMGVSRSDMKTALAAFKPGGNRMNQIPLREGGLVIDDSYNANPLSMIAALEACREIAQGRRMVAVLGDMLELGTYEKEGHIKVGQKAAEIGLDLLVTIGERAQYYREGASQQGMSSSRIFHFSSREEALTWMKEHVRPADLVLFKASRGMQLDKLVHDWIS